MKRLRQLDRLDLLIIVFVLWVIAQSCFVWPGV